jgi:hypothetical protein
MLQLLSIKPEPNAGHQQEKERKKNYLMIYERLEEENPCLA